MEVKRIFDSKGNLIHFSCKGYSCDTEYAENNEIIKKTICGEIHLYQQKSPQLMLPPNKLGIFYNNVQHQLKHENKSISFA